MRDERNVASTKEGQKQHLQRHSIFKNSLHVFREWEKVLGLWSGGCSWEHQGTGLKKGSGQIVGIWTLPHGQWRTTRDCEQGVPRWSPPIVRRGQCTGKDAGKTGWDTAVHVGDSKD